MTEMMTEMTHHRIPPCGPRPLALHMAMLTMLSATSLGALSAWKNGSLPWNPVLAPKAADLLEELGGLSLSDFATAVTRENRRRIEAFAMGVQRYATYPRVVDDRPKPEVIWTGGSTRVLDYGGTGAPLLVIPSLINRYHILDLHTGYSFARGLLRMGIRPLVVDWGSPGSTEASFDIGCYVTRRLEPIIGHICEHVRPNPTNPTNPTESVHVAGYCMGGLLATALATRVPDRVRSLALLATPWNFHAGRGHGGQDHGERGPAIRMPKAALAQINAVIDMLGELPVDVLQAMFVGLNPWLAITKFQRFSTMPVNTPQADAFVALEDWLNDGVPLVAGVARECLGEWYGDNSPYRRTWKVGGTVIDPSGLSVPVLIVIPRQDHIVPPGQAEGLRESVPHARVMYVSTGHIGMVSGRRSEASLCRPMGEWIQKIP